MFESNNVYDNVEFHLNGKNIHYFDFVINGIFNHQFAVTLTLFEKEEEGFVGELKFKRTLKIIGLETTKDKHIFHLKDIEL